MKRISKILILFHVICLFCDIANAQNDAFFYENYEQRIENNHIGFNFGHFSTDETGFNFGHFSTDETGLNFGEFDFVDVEAPLGSGLLLLSGLAFVRLRIKKRK